MEHLDRPGIASGRCHIWFRGHSNAEWKLEPKVFRLGRPLPSGAEVALFDEFERRGRTLTDLMTDRWRSYFLMQHYGIPTRLLDWTDSALTALFFALRDSRADDGDGAVWAVNPNWLNEKSLGKWGMPDVHSHLLASHYRDEDPVAPGERVMAIMPPWIDRRMFAQRSYFTLHGTKLRPLEQFSYIRTDCRLLKFVISAGNRNSIMDSLRTCGVTDTTLFPDLDGLAKEIVRDYID